MAIEQNDALNSDDETIEFDFHGGFFSQPSNWLIKVILYLCDDKKFESDMTMDLFIHTEDRFNILFRID